MSLLRHWLSFVQRCPWRMSLQSTLMSSSSHTVTPVDCLWIFLTQRVNNFPFTRRQISSESQRIWTRQSEASVVGKAQRTSINWGQAETAVPSRTSSRPGLWLWHGQQGEWAGLLRRHVGRSLQWQMCPPTDHWRGLQDGRGWLQMQRCHGSGEHTKWPSRSQESATFFPVSNYWIVF